MLLLLFIGLVFDLNIGDLKFLLIFKVVVLSSIGLLILPRISASLALNILVPDLGLVGPRLIILTQQVIYHLLNLCYLQFKIG